MSRTYRLSDVLSEGLLARNRDLLVAGPSPETVRTIPERLLGLAADAGDGAVVVTNRDAAETMADRLVGQVPALDRERTGIVDCTPTHDVGRATPDDLRWSVPSPTDLTGANMAVHDCMETLWSRGVSARHLMFDSLSTLLVSADSGTVTRYAHQLLLLASSHDGVSLFPVYTNMTEGTDFERLKHLFDGLVLVRRRGGGRQIRCVGIDGAPAGWLTVEADGG
ncbi:DUF7504 family protein [Haloarchaeobius sp. TZWWS8]|uniref:DUF7504 family protein n=1 Tax=Haloarchaeobius sp. TZWWS8 TaxID=3446121 RepID=UPI003EBDFD1C